MTHESTPSPVSEERTLAVIGNLTRASGFMGSRQKAYSLIITDRRLVFAELTKEKMKELLAQAKNDAKGGGKGLLGQLGAQAKAADGYHERYRQMPPDAALAETPGNFAIERGLIKKVKFKDGSIGDPDATNEEVIIKTTTEKIRLILVRSLLSTVKEQFRAAGIG